MKLYYVYILVFTLQLARIVMPCQSLSEIKETAPLIKKIGEQFNMRCPLHPCNESGIYNFTKVNMNTGKLELVYQGRELDTIITDLSDAGTYCCKPYCDDNTRSCCVNIQVQSEITFQMSEIAYIHHNYTTSCTIKSSHRANLYIYTRGCWFQHATSLIDEDTTEAIIVISNITQECRNITCSTNLFQKSKTVELLPSPEPTEPTTLITPKTQFPTRQQAPNEETNLDDDHSSTSSTVETNTSSDTTFPITTSTIPSGANTYRYSLILIVICALIILYL